VSSCPGRWIAAGVAVLAALGFVFMRRQKPEEESGEA